jgi:Ca2+-binding EF-hand superfamily protein
MMTRSGIIALATLIAALLLFSCATTEDKQAQMDRDALCSSLDTNHDGKITPEEFMARTSDKNMALAIFRQCDTGNKGYLTYDELWNQRMILPPELLIYTPPLVRPAR